MYAVRPFPVTTIFPEEVLTTRSARPAGRLLGPPPTVIAAATTAATAMPITAPKIRMRWGLRVTFTRESGTARP
jgi:hypothetical protein